MEFQRVSPFVDESRKLSESEFASRHGSPAFLIEPFDASSARDLKDTTSELALDAAAQTPYAIHAAARLVWIGPNQGIVRLGRDSVCEIPFPHPNVSKHHAIIQRTRTGWCLTDEGSRNGTTLNGRRLGRAELVTLSDGDAIGLGGVVMLRPFFTPAILYSLLRGPEKPAPAAAPDATPAADATPVPEAAVYPELGERLASAFRALGLAVEVAPGSLTVAGLDGVSKARLTLEPGALLVELVRCDVGIQRKQFPAGAEAEEAVRKHVLEVLGFF